MTLTTLEHQTEKLNGHKVFHEVDPQQIIPSMLKEIANFTIAAKYAKYDEKKKRRETWSEISDRVLDMHLMKYSWLPEDKKQKIREVFQRVAEKRAVPSMRSMQFGGNAIFAHEARIYNCAVRHIDSLRAFAEVFYLLLCGTGVGIGLKKKFLNRLPKLVGPEHKTGSVIIYSVEDTIEGWADSVEALMMCYFRNTPYTGRKIEFDYSKIRKKGEKLKTSGGKAPGYKGLKKAHQKIKRLLDYIIEDLGQNRLEPINAYDILMHSADAVLSGGVRRSATSVIFDIGDAIAESKTNFRVKKVIDFEKNEKTGKWDGHVVLVDDAAQKKLITFPEKNLFEVSIKDWEYEQLKKEKTIAWWNIEPQRGRSNNSVILMRDQVTKEEFEKIVEHTKQYGEPGFVFADHEDTLFNPCFEISFIPVLEDGRCGVQFCNLTTQNGAKIETLEDFFQATEDATILGTLQAGYTNFQYLSEAARELTEEEALLGVSITGILDNPKILLDPRNQYLAAQLAVRVNKEWAQLLGINQAARITCLKPEGTSSLALESASGIHPHHARQYLRRIQMNKQDNVYRFFKKHNPQFCEESVHSENKTDDVIVFPLRIPDSAMVKDDMTAIQHLNIVKDTQQNWVQTGITEANKKQICHNVSCTIEVDQNEWDEVVDYLYQNRKFFCAVSLLGKVNDKIFDQAPLERMTSEEDSKKFEELTRNFKHVDYTQLTEDEDKTEMMQTVACAGNTCEVVF